MPSISRGFTSLLQAQIKIKHGVDKPIIKESGNNQLPSRLKVEKKVSTVQEHSRMTKAIIKTGFRLPFLCQIDPIDGTV